MDICEICYKISRVELPWFVIDNNMEIQAHAKCAKNVSKEIICEICYKISRVELPWFVIDNNMEIQAHAKCAKNISKEIDVERIEA